MHCWLVVLFIIAALVNARHWKPNAQSYASFQRLIAVVLRLWVDLIHINSKPCSGLLVPFRTWPALNTQQRQTGDFGLTPTTAKNCPAQETFAHRPRLIPAPGWTQDGVLRLTDNALYYLKGFFYRFLM